MSNVIQPKLKKEYLEYVLIAGSEIPTVNLQREIENPSHVPLKFSAELSLGGELPVNLSCSEEGRITGTLEKNTATFLPYSVLVVAQAEGVEPLTFEVYLHVDPPLGAAFETESGAELEGEEAALTGDETAEPAEMEFNLEQFDQYWHLFSEKMDLPDLEELLTRRVTPREIYYFINKFATLTVWNSDDFRPADNGKLLDILDENDQFLVYDFEVALVATPKELFSTSRTPKDARSVAAAMIQEAHHRKWNVELAGFDKMVSAAWVEAEYLNKTLEDAEYKMAVKNFIPSQEDWAYLSERLGLNK